MVITLRLIGLVIGLFDPAGERTGGSGLAGPNRQLASLETSSTAPPAATLAPAPAPAPASGPAADPAEIVGTIAAWSVPVLGLAAGVASVHWLHRVWGNWATQGRPRHGESWVVLAWLVPPLNLWRPAEIVMDMFADRPGMRSIDTSSSWLIALWWIPGVLGVASTALLVLRGDWFPPTEARHQLLVAHILLAISAASGRWLITELTSRHDLRG